MTTPAGSVGYQYDSAGNLVAETDARGYVIQHIYNGDNRLTSVIDPEGGVIEYTDDIHGKLTQVILPNGLSRRIDYDDLDRPVREDVRLTVRQRQDRSRLAAR